MRQQISSGIDVAVSYYGFAATHLHLLRNELLKEVFTMLLLLLVVFGRGMVLQLGRPAFLSSVCRSLQGISFVGRRLACLVGDTRDIAHTLAARCNKTL